MAGQIRPENAGSAWAKAQPYVDATWEFVAATALGTAGGWWLDRKFHTQPWLLVVGSVFGFAAGMTVMFRTILTLSARDQAEQEARAKDRKDRP